MPVVRSKGERVEAGRGYPRLKWSDLAKFNTTSSPIAGDEWSSFVDDHRNLFNDRTCHKNDECNSVNRRKNADSSQTRLIEESAINDDAWSNANYEFNFDNLSLHRHSSSINNNKSTLVDRRSLLTLGMATHDSLCPIRCAAGGAREESLTGDEDFRSLRTKVRMAFTVPLTRFAARNSSSATRRKKSRAFLLCAQHHQPSLLKSFSYRGKSDGDKFSNKRNVATTKRIEEAEEDDRNNVPHAVAPIIPERKYYTNNNYLSDYTTMPRQHEPQTERNSDSFRHFRHPKKESARNVTSFWREIKTGGRTCLMSRRNREATFIISPAPSPSIEEETEEVLSEIIELSLPRISLSFPQPSFFQDERVSETTVPPSPSTASPVTLSKYRTVRDLRDASLKKVSKQSGGATTGQRSSSGVSHLPKRSPSLGGSRRPSSDFSLGGKQTPLKEPLRHSLATKKTLSKIKAPDNSPLTTTSRSSHNHQSSLLQKTTASVSPAPATHNYQERSQSHLKRFGFKSRPTLLLKSGESTDSVNSILSDAQTDGQTNCDWKSKHSRPTSLRDDEDLVKVHDEDLVRLRESSSCTISQASSGVTSSAAKAKEKLTTQAKRLPEPQTVAMKSVFKGSQKTIVPPSSSYYEGRKNENKILPSSSPYYEGRKNENKILPSSLPYYEGRKNDKTHPSSSCLVVPKSSSKIPQTKSSLLKSQRTKRDFEFSNKSLNTLDSGLGSSSESDRIKSREVPGSSLPVVSKKITIKDGSTTDIRCSNAVKCENKLELDISDAWLMEKKYRGPVAKKRDSVRNDKTKDHFKDKRDTNVTYGMARQKFAPYSRNRFPHSSVIETSTSTTLSDSKTTTKTTTGMSSSKKFPTTGIVRSRIEKLEKTPTENSKKPTAITPKKTESRVATTNKTPEFVSRISENSDSSRRLPVVCRRLKYGGDRGKICEESVGKIDKESLDSSESKRVKDLSENEKNPENCNQTESSGSSIEVIDPSPDSELDRQIVLSDLEATRRTDHQGKNRSVSSVKLLLSELVIREDEDPMIEKSNRSKSSTVKMTGSGGSMISSNVSSGGGSMISSNISLEGSMVSSTTSTGSRTFTIGTHHSSSPRNSSERSSEAGGKCTPTTTLSSHRGEMDHDFLIDDEISDQPGLTFGDEELIFEDEDLFADDILGQRSPPILENYSDDLNLPLDLYGKACTDRSRHESQGTVSSIGGDELMLDYDQEEHKNSLRSNRKAQLCAKSHLRQQFSTALTIPGPRYDTYVSTPTASEILSEWTSMLAEVGSSSSNQSPCISSEPVVTGINSLGGSIPTNTAINTQPVNGFDFHRTRAGSVDLDTKKAIHFKPPRMQNACTDADQNLNVDRTNFHYICQDVTAMKTLLLKLRRVLQVAETRNPFDDNFKSPPQLEATEHHSSSLLLSSSSGVDDYSGGSQENFDLKRQVILLQQRLDEKDRSISILEQQLSQALHANRKTRIQAPQKFMMTQSLSRSSSLESDNRETTNAATQTERSSHRSPSTLTSMSRTSSEEDGLGPTVSSEYLRKSTSSQLPDWMHLTPSSSVEIPPTRFS